MRTTDARMRTSDASSTALRLSLVARMPLRINPLLGRDVGFPHLSPSLAISTSTKEGLTARWNKRMMEMQLKSMLLKLMTKNKDRHLKT
ncbi:hypothetical protein ACLB2K_022596 [Fragaria x ananassa]